MSDHLERKYCELGAPPVLGDDHVIEGYASIFGRIDQSGDRVEAGAYRRTLAQLAQSGRAVKMLWQHDPEKPIGVWDEVREDATGLFVKGRILQSIAQGREAATLIEAGAIDGLSIGYRTVTARKDKMGRRVLADLDLWEISLVTFPMLPEARVGAKGHAPEENRMRQLAAVFEDARQMLARCSASDPNPQKSGPTYGHR